MVLSYVCKDDIPHFYIFFVQTFAANVKAELQKFPEDDRDDVVILFSAHSLPLKVSVSQPCVTG